MRDRELLEAAARAAGYTVALEKNHDWPSVTDDEGLTWPWNPLEDNADAFRLMVDLKILVSLSPGIVIARCDGHDRHEYTDTDSHAATRRAIVRAAAAMSEGRE